MMPKITEKDIKHIAKLAKLDIKSSEINKFNKQLSEIVDYVSELSEVDTKDLEETSRTIKLENVLREDVTYPSLNQEEATSRSDSVYNGYFKVPAILEEKER